MGVGRAAMFAEGVDEATALNIFAAAIAERMQNMDITPEITEKIIDSWNNKKMENKFSLNENLSESKQQSIQHFVEFATKRLKLKETPKISLVGGREFAEVKTSLGGFDPVSKEIYVATEGRLTADILRTLAHEMVHRKQDELGLVRNPEKDGADGSPIENQAHAGMELDGYVRGGQLEDLTSLYASEGWDKIFPADFLPNSEMLLLTLGNLSGQLVVKI